MPSHTEIREFARFIFSNEVKSGPSKFVPPPPTEDCLHIIATYRQRPLDRNGAFVRHSIAGKRNTKKMISRGYTESQVWVNFWITYARRPGQTNAFKRFCQLQGVVQTVDPFGQETMPHHAAGVQIETSGKARMNKSGEDSKSASQTKLLGAFRDFITKTLAQTQYTSHDERVKTGWQKLSAVRSSTSVPALIHQATEEIRTNGHATQSRMKLLTQRMLAVQVLFVKLKSALTTRANVSISTKAATTRLDEIARNSSAAELKLSRGA